MPFLIYVFLCLFKHLFYFFSHANQGEKFACKQAVGRGPDFRAHSLSLREMRSCLHRVQRKSALAHVTSTLIRTSPFTHLPKPNVVPEFPPLRLVRQCLRDPRAPCSHGSCLRWHPLRLYRGYSSGCLSILSHHQSVLYSLRGVIF